ncbi:MAG: Rpn family recombination-promoting nuclease/putative transposase [Magnetococcus sp. DMHC-1]
MVDLLRHFLPLEILIELDLSRLERKNVKFHAETGEHRTSDIIWKIPTRSGANLYIFLILEFQSKVAWWMSVRFQVYSGLLYQQLIQEEKLQAGDLLPPILPVVIHNGPRPWRAPTSTNQLIGLPEDSILWKYQPTMQYILLDERQFSEEQLKKYHSLTAMLFRLEQVPDPEKITKIVDELVAWFKTYPDFQPLQNLFVELLRRELARYQDKTRIVHMPEDLLEIKAMFHGLQEYKQKLIRDSKREGIKEGKKKGKKEGKKEGILKGRRNEVSMILRSLLQKKFGPEIPGWIEEKLVHATLEELEGWTLRTLDAKAPEDLFIH